MQDAEKRIPGIWQPGLHGSIAPRSHAIAVMAKAPVAGAVKSRLVPPLTSREAASLNRAFLEDLCSSIESARAIAARQSKLRVDGFIAYTPAGAEAAFADTIPASFRLITQRGDDLSARLINAAEELLCAGYESVSLMNSDSPTLPSSYIAQALLALDRAGDRIVLGGADDGGYYLIGLKRAHRRIFEQIGWSSAAVFAQTLERAAELGLEVTTLPPWFDVDDRASLRRLIDEMFGTSGRGTAPATRSSIERLLADGLRSRLAADQLAGPRYRPED